MADGPSLAVLHVSKLRIISSGCSFFMIDEVSTALPHVDEHVAASSPLIS